MLKRLIVSVIPAFTLAVGLYGQSPVPESGSARLVSRQIEKQTGKDNYVDAAFSFEHAVNGSSGISITNNDWDVLFSSVRRADGFVEKDVFDVTMVTDDRSRLVDLGDHQLADAIELPELPAFQKPTREKSVEALAGHVYLVHIADRNSDFYAIFRVDELKSGEFADISWKRITVSTEK